MLLDTAEGISDGTEIVILPEWEQERQTESLKLC